MKRPVVLIVEDNPDDQTLMQLAIAEARASFEAVFVPDGQDALDWLFRQGAHADRDEGVFPALVLLDLKLTRLSGLDVLRALRGDPLGRLIAVVVLVIGSAWLLIKFKDSSAMLDCYASGRKNCQMVDVPSGQ